MVQHSINNSEVGKDLHTWHAQNRYVSKMQVSLAHGIDIVILKQGPDPHCAQFPSSSHERSNSDSNLDYSADVVPAANRQ